jgi:hypothetical protein
VSPSELRRLQEEALVGIVGIRARALLIRRVNEQYQVDIPGRDKRGAASETRHLPVVYRISSPRASRQRRRGR